MGENFEALILNLIAKFPKIGTVLIFLGAIIVVGKAIIDMTPTSEDDEWYEVINKNPITGRVLRFISQFAPLQPKVSK
jgi:hypothetical protein